MNASPGLGHDGHVESDITSRLAIARVAAARAGEFLLNDRPESLAIETKSTPTDVVSAMDRGAEQIIVQMIDEHFPDDGLLGEEGSARPGRSGFRWVIDPLDGTVNYLYRLPHWGVAIGIECDQDAVAGVVTVPRLGLEYTAAVGHGAYRTDTLGERAIHASAVQSLSLSLVATGFNYDAQVRTWQADAIRHVIPVVRDIRRLGAGAVDLCLVADGTVDAYFEYGLHPWDLCAGSLIAREAGASVTGMHGQPAGSDMVIAAAPGITHELVQLIESSVQPA